MNSVIGVGQRWKIVGGNKRRLKEGFEKFRMALEQDAKEAATRGSGLPKDWRSRILKGV